MSRRVIIVVVCVVVAMLLSLVLAPFKTTTYQSTARILLDDGSNPNDSFAVDPADAGRAARRALARAQSPVVGTIAQAQVGFAATIDALVANDTEVLQLRAFEPDPKQAVQVAQAYADAYLEVAQDERRAEQLAVEEQVLKRIEQLDDEIAAMGDQDASRLRDVRADLEESYDRLVLVRDLGQGGADQLIDAPRLPTTPFSVQDRTNPNLLFGGIAGLAVGTGAVLIERRRAASAVS